MHRGIRFCFSFLRRFFRGRDMRVPRGEEHAVLHVITESEGVAVSTSSTSSAGSADEHWVRSTRRL